jgi:TetR/AcrR family transcriptional regulator, regulator of autoinduction and epiphytic fitness
MTTDSMTPTIDGRRARGERTKAAVIEAYLSLVDSGELHPTAQQVANHAGVALRTVYHHFDDVESLRRSALELHLGRHVTRLKEVDPTSPLDGRVAEVTRELRRFFEAITPIRRATLIDEHSSNDVAAGIKRTREHRRAFLERAFQHELARSSDRRVLLDAIDAAASWYHWHFVRSSLGRSVAAAEKILGHTLAELLGTERVAVARATGSKR